ncbi:MAG: hypothetical protein WA081_01275 [Desulfosalsimonadaceae bacterium]
MRFNRPLGAGWLFRSSSRWLFVEVTPGMEFPQKIDYEFTPYIDVKFEVVFDDEG